MFRLASADGIIDFSDRIFVAEYSMGALSVSYLIDPSLNGDPCAADASTNGT